MVGELLMKSSKFMLRRELFDLSPSLAAPKSLYLPSARVRFGRNNHNNVMSSSGVSKRLVLAVPPSYKLDNVILSSSPPSYLPDSSCSSGLESKNNQHSAVITVCDKIDEIKNKVFKLLASLLLFGFLAFMTSLRRSLSAYASTSSSCVSTSTSTSSSLSPSYVSTSSSCVSTSTSTSTSTSSSLSPSYVSTSSSCVSTSTSTSFSLSPSYVSTSCTNCDCAIHDTICNCDCHLGTIFACSLLLTSLLGFVAVFLSIGISLVFLVVHFTITLILVKISFIGLALCIMVPPVVALVDGFFYFLQLCKDDKMSVLVLQVGVLDKMRELQTELVQTADTSNLDAIKMEGVMKSLLQRYDSCHFAQLTVTQCISDEIKYGEDNDEMDSICDANPLAYYKMLKCFIKGLVVVIHSAMKIIKKIHYDGKYSKQLFREVLSRELVQYDRDKEAFSNIDCMKYEKKTVGEEHCMVDNNYLVVTMVVLASGIYSVPSSVCNTEHIKTVFQEFNTIPMNKVESVEVFWTLQTEDEVVSKQELQRDFQ